MSPADNTGREGGIGARLQAARKRRGLTPAQAAERMHLDPLVVEALESENFASLGATVFVRGHLRRYAELLGESSEELQQLYSRSTHAGSVPDLTRIAQAERPPADRRRYYLPGIALLLTFGIAGAVWWVLNDLRRPQPSPFAGAPAATARGAPDAPSITSAPVLPAASLAPPAPRPVREEATAPSAASGAAAAPAVAQVPAAAVPVPTAEGSSLDQLSPDALVGAAPVRGAASSPPQPRVVASRAGPGPDGTSAATARDVRLTLRFSADSWVEVYDSGGKRLFYDVGSADSVQQLSGAAPLRVTLGNPPAVAVEVNGNSAVLPERASRDQTVQFVVEPSGRLVRTRTTSGGG